MRDTTGNLPPLPGIYPDYLAPIVRNGADGVRELVRARWGMPSSQRALLDAAQKRARKLEAKGRHVDFKELLRMEPDSGTTNIRNVSSQHWKRWLGPEHRCLEAARLRVRVTRTSARCVVRQPVRRSGEPTSSAYAPSRNAL
jgi:putative SOS response-associated peptidase YedK